MVSARARRTTGSRLELHLRRRGGVGGCLEELLGREAGQARHHVGGEARHARVVFAYGLVEAPTVEGDAVLGALELALERQEVLVALELGIALHRDEQAA